VLKIAEPHSLTDPLVNYIVLGFALFFEGTALSIAIR
jgi:hypothetical protein